MSTGTGREVTVLHGLRPPTRDTTYVSQVLASAPPEVRVLLFSWWRALGGGYDVLHLHWPEHLLRSSARWRRPMVRVLFLLLLARLAVVRVPLVRTVHNLVPHDPPSRTERWLLALCDRRTSMFVHLNTCTPERGGTPSRVIPLGHYRDWLAAHAQQASQPGSVLFFGRVERYKRVDRLVDAVRTSQREDLRLRVVGRVLDPGLHRSLTAAATLDDRITLRSAFVDDAEMVAEMTRADLVVLPYEEMHNSGVLLVALSLGRRVLAPRTPVNESLAAEVGPGWVDVFDGPFTTEVLESSLSRPYPATPPRLTGRDSDVLGEQHHQAYLAVLGRPDPVGDLVVRGG